jgi:hypothetical protein
MGIKQSTGGPGAVFYKINAKEGCFQAGREKFEPGRTELTGVLMGFKIEDNEFEGQKSEALRMIFKDPEGGPNMHVSMTITSGEVPGAMALRTLSKLNACDIGQPISLTPYLLEKGSPTMDGKSTLDNDVVGVSVKQGGQKIKEDLGTPDNKLPDRPDVLTAAGKPVMVQGKPLKESSSWSALLDAQLDRFTAKFPSAPAQAEAGVDANEAASGAERAGMRARG